MQSEKRAVLTRPGRRQVVPDRRLLPAVNVLGKTRVRRISACFIRNGDDLPRGKSDRDFGFGCDSHHRWPDRLPPCHTVRG